MTNETDFYTTLTSTLQELVLRVQELKSKEIKSIYTNKEMMNLLDASSATLKKWRDEGELSYSLVGATYYYSKKDVEDFLKNHHFDAYACSL
ncbi:MAG: helix-turn-helix domain-containing protein [Bacteroidales bacterium]|nr:helix-turn-helix domain-containing protein [Bacteroidales bacterium]